MPPSAADTVSKICPENLSIEYGDGGEGLQIAYNLASPSPQPSRRRRTSSAAGRIPPTLRIHDADSAHNHPGASSGLPADGFAQPLPPIPGTPYARHNMSLSRSPSPRRGGGWSSPGLTSNFDSVSGTSSPRKTYGEIQHMNGATSSSNVTWSSTKAKSDEIKSKQYPGFQTRNNGFFSRHARRLSGKLPSFNMGGRYAEKEKLQRGRCGFSNATKAGRVLNHIGRVVWRLRLRLMVLLGLVFAVILFYTTRES